LINAPFIRPSPMMRSAVANVNRIMDTDTGRIGTSVPMTA
jgi:hypothetical protein